MGSEASIKPGEIHDALKRIWDKLEGTGKMRASLFNLIFYTEKTPRSDYFRKTAQAVVEKFPSRVIFISSDKSSPENKLDVKVSVLVATKGESDVACDLIELDVAGSGHPRIPFVVLPHILTDLPIYLIWAADPSIDDSIFFDMKKIATRLICDSECAGNLSDFAGALLHHHAFSHIDIGDLNWARVENWRDVLSTTFYADEKLKDLSSMKEITITYNSAATAFFCHTNIQALYLQTWLASRLSWKLQNVRKEKEGQIFSYQSSAGPVTILLQPTQNANLAPGMVLGIEMLAANGDQYKFYCHPEVTHQITLSFSTAELCEMPTNFLFPKGEKGQSLVKEICQSGTSQHFLDVLKILSELKKEVLC